MIPKCQTLFRPVDSNHYPYLAAWACLFNLFHFAVSLKFRGLCTSTGQPLKFKNSTSGRWSYQHPTLEVLLFALLIAIWLCIHEIYIHIHSDMTFHHPFSSSSAITLPHQKKRSPCTFYDPILYHLVSTRPAGLWQGSWLWDLWSSCSCAIISV